MKTLTKKYIILLFLAMGCAYDPASPLDDGNELPTSADFTRFFVMGDKFASGFMDGTLYNGGQQYSYPSLLAQVLDSVNGEPTFQQALVSSERGMNAELSNEGKFYLEYPSSNYIYTYRNTEAAGSYSQASVSLQSLRDFSFPGLTVFNVDDASSLNGNIYYERVFTQNESPLAQLTANDPGVVLVSFGMDALYRYALAGASGSENEALADLGETDLLLPADFEQSLSTIITSILDNTEADVVLTNLYDPLLSPFFTTINTSLETEIYPSSYVSDLIGYYADFNTNVFTYNQIENDLPREQRRTTIDYDIENWPLVSPEFRARVIRDEYTPVVYLNDGTEIPNIRRLNEDEYVLYHVVKDISPGSDFSSRIPMTDEMVLVEQEIEIIDQRREAFNQIIETIAAGSDRIMVADIASVVEQVANEEYNLEGVGYSAKFDRYGIFSADGYSFNPRGNALIARTITRQINEYYGSSIPLINPNVYRGTSFIYN